MELLIQQAICVNYQYMLVCEPCICVYVGIESVTSIKSYS